MKNLSSREKMLLAVGTYVALAVLYYFAVIDRTWSEANRLQMREIELQSELSKLEGKTKELRVGAKPEVKINRQFGKLLTSTSEASHAAEIIATVAAAAKASGVRVTAYHPRAKRLDGEHWVRLPMEITATGTVAELTDFLYRLTYNPWLLDVEQISVRKSGDTSRDLSSTMVLSSSAWVTEIKIGQKAGGARATGRLTASRGNG